MSVLKIITNVKPESEQLLVAEMSRKNASSPLVYVTENETVPGYLLKILKFYNPTRHVLLFPAWDSIPYRRASPSNFVMATRIKALLDIMTATEPYIVLTTISAITQKVLPKKVVPHLILEIHPGEQLTTQSVIEYLVAHGYSQVSAVREAGSFAVRGDIIDVFQPVNSNPTRIDFCDDTVESIRHFDFNTQLTVNEHLKKLTIYPTSEVVKKQENLEEFRKKCTNSTDHPMIEAILTGHKCVGEEYWLPLFQQEALETFFDYVAGAELMFGASLLDSIEKNAGKIQKDYLCAEQKSQQFISPSELYLDPQEYKQITQSFNKIIFCPFDNVPEQVKSTYGNAIPSRSVLRAVPNFRLLAREKNADVFATAAVYMQQCNSPIVLACYSEGSLQYLSGKFSTLGIHFSRIETYTEIGGRYNIAIIPIGEGDSITPSITIITEHSLLKRQCTSGDPSNAVLCEDIDLSVGDIVVHQDYGIGRFTALKTLEVLGNSHDFIELVYRNDDKLFVPVEYIDLVTKYGTSEGVILDKLGNTAWQERKARLKNRIKDIAHTILHAEAVRLLTPGCTFCATQQYSDFCKEFPYIETGDQIRAITDVETDLASGKIMNRLICGDVGFGKTEVALRAAFLVTNDDPTSQVAMIVPTTLLCRQHFAVFRDRFKNYSGIRIEQLSKTTSKLKAKETKELLADGMVNIVIGTSALLFQDVTFFNLSLLIIDEEQHFGVQQKEKLKALKHDVHVLSLSATPIPRTLNMSLSGIRDLSTIRTPPMGRVPIDVFVIDQDDNTIKEAILNEVNRGGQVFYICPLISDIDGILNYLRKLVSGIGIETAHGKMPASALDNVMNRFLDGKFRVLLTTSIIESGIDIPSVNTIIIHNADMFGLAQLYQLKGRVGRHNLKGYAYLIASNKALIQTPGMKRLETIKSLNRLGSGFSIALQDMDMRGFGNIIGEEQSGNIKEVGVELYHKMLEEEIEACRGHVDHYAGSHSIKVDINTSIGIPESYIKELDLRMRVYRKIGYLRTEEEIESYSIELVNRFGTLPTEVVNLLNIIHMRQLCNEIGIQEINQTKNYLILKVGKDMARSKRLLSYLVSNPTIFKIRDNDILMSVHQHNTNLTAHILSHLIKIRNATTSEKQAN